MHVVIFSTYYLPHAGGVEHYVQSLAKELQRHGHDVTIVTCNTEHAKQRETLDGIDVVRLPCVNLLGGTQATPYPSPKSTDLLSSIRNPDVVITNTRFYPLTLVGMGYAEDQGAPLVHVEHGNRHVPHENALVREAARLWDKTLGRAVLSIADRVVCVSEPGRTFVERLGADAEKVVVIPNGIDLTTLPKRRKPRGKKRNVAYLGRLIQAKGVQDLLAAAQDLPDIHLDIIGDGPYRETLEKRAKQLGLDATFHGQLPRKEALRILAGSDVLVNPSYAEGLPTSVLEAAAIGVPVVATDVGGTRDILPRRSLCAPEDVECLRKKILAAKEDARLRKRTRKDYSWESVGVAFVRLLERMKNAR